MRKLLLVLLAMPVLSFASSLDMSTLACGDASKETPLKINASTTLQQVQDHCLIKSEKSKDGMYQVKFANDGAKNSKGKSPTVTCNFAKNDPTAVVNGCK